MRVAKTLVGLLHLISNFQCTGRNLLFMGLIWQILFTFKIEIFAELCLLVLIEVGWKGMFQKKLMLFRAVNSFKENKANSLTIVFIEFLPLEKHCTNCYTNKQIKHHLSLSGTIKLLQVK